MCRNRTKSSVAYQSTQQLEFHMPVVDDIEVIIDEQHNLAMLGIIANDHIIIQVCLYSWHGIN